MIPSDHLILCHPLLLLLSIPASIRVFSNQSVLCIKWPKYWSFSFSISPSKEYSGLISFRIDWLELAIQGTLQSILQHHSLKASILWLSNFFMVQLSHPYVTTGKNHSFDYMGTLDSKVMSQLFNMLSRFVIAFLWTPSTVILEPKKIKSATVFIVFPSICHEVMEPDAMILVF